MSSVLRVVSIENGHVREVDDYQRHAVRRFRDSKKCPVSRIDPDVWGLGWDATGEHILALIQATVHRPCGESGDYYGMELDRHSGAVARQLSEVETRRQFGALLPPGIREGK
jgi:hypothetical protein